MTPATTGRVPNVEISQNPVAKTPTMLPRVAAAWIRPTTRPVTSSELSESFTIIGVIVPSRTEGRKKRSAVSHSTCNSAPHVVGAAIESRFRESTSIEPRGERAEEIEQRQHRAAGPAVGDPAADPVAEAETGEHDADHRGPRVERDAEQRRDDAPGDDLEHQQAAAPEEGERAREAKRPDVAIFGWHGGVERAPEAPGDRRQPTAFGLRSCQFRRPLLDDPSERAILPRRATPGEGPMREHGRFGKRSGRSQNRIGQPTASRFQLFRADSVADGEPFDDVSPPSSTTASRFCYSTGEPSMSTS